MTANAFGGDDATCGAMTSGGTESILMAMKVNPGYAVIFSPIPPLL